MVVWSALPVDGSMVGVPACTLSRAAQNSADCEPLDADSLGVDSVVSVGAMLVWLSSYCFCASDAAVPTMAAPVTRVTMRMIVAMMPLATLT